MLGFIREMAKEQDDICLHDGRRHLVDVQKKIIQIVVSVPLKQQLEKENLIIK